MNEVRLMGCLHTYIICECLRVHRYAQLRAVNEIDFASWLSSDVGSIDHRYRIGIEPLIKFASLQDSGHLFTLLWAAVYNGGSSLLRSLLGLRPTFLLCSGNLSAGFGRQLALLRYGRYCTEAGPAQQ